MDEGGARNNSSASGGENLWLYRSAMFATALMSVVAVVLLCCHWAFGLLSAKAVRVMTFGSVFWLLIAFGYRADFKARQAGNP